MASRILVAAIGIPLLLVLLLLSPPICLAVVLGLLSAIAVYELLGQTGYLKQGAMLVVSMLMAFLVPFWIYYDCNIVAAIAAIMLFLVILFSIAFASHGEITLGQIGGCALGSIAFPVMISAMLLLSDLENYRLLVLLPFISSFCSDASALFAGMLFGKRKLAPELSPNKTVAGAIGGLLGAMLGCSIYAAILYFLVGVWANLGVFLIYGLLASAISQFGDLTFSYVKRQFSIKDYGHLFLAHGGVLDRFDSVIFCTPLTVVMAYLFPFFLI